MEKPFKFGTIVEDEYFTDRQEKVRYICQFLNKNPIQRLLSNGGHYKWPKFSLTTDLGKK